jgi:hypothetical protein
LQDVPKPFLNIGFECLNETPGTLNVPVHANAVETVARVLLVVRLDQRADVGKLKINVHRVVHFS